MVPLECFPEKSIYLLDTLGYISSLFTISKLFSNYVDCFMKYLLFLAIETLGRLELAKTT